MLYFCGYKAYSMNRLILIGNGFDLAHKIKTSYSDFLLDYLKDAFIHSRDHGKYEDEFLVVVQNSNFDDQLNDPYIINWELTNFFGYISQDESFGITVSGNVIRKKTFEYHLIIKNNLISALISSYKDFNWVDIENEYYKILCELSSKNKIKEIKELNKGFKFLQDLLYKYLVKVEEEHLSKISDISKSKLINQLLEDIMHNAAPKITRAPRISNLSSDQNNIRKEKGPKPSSILFLNFNYTSTVEKYVKEIQKKVSKTDIIYIHGKLKDIDNPMVFGYGDEEETNFEVLEKYNECLEYVKTYWYLRTNNYENFLKFIDSDDFEVYIMGHSCGMSDKTMLSSIFNNERCKKIKILTYDKSFGAKDLAINTTNYIEMTYQIGRLFKNKADLRKKIISFNVNDLLKLDFDVANF